MHDNGCVRRGWPRGLVVRAGGRSVLCWGKRSTDVRGASSGCGGSDRRRRGRYRVERGVGMWVAVLRSGVARVGPGCAGLGRNFGGLGHPRRTRRGAIWGAGVGRRWGPGWRGWGGGLSTKGTKDAKGGEMGCRGGVCRATMGGGVARVGCGWAGMGRDFQVTDMRSRLI